MKKQIIMGSLAIAMSTGGMCVSAQDIQPYQFQTIQPYQSQTIQPVNSTPIQPVNSTPVQPDNSGSTSNQQTNDRQADLSFFFHIWGLHIPGGTWVIPGGSDYDVLHTGIGSGPTGSIKINSDGTYVWNSSWDSTVYTGNWEKGDSGTLIIRGAQSGTDWRISQYRGKFYIDDFNYTTYEGTQLD